MQQTQCAVTKQVVNDVYDKHSQADDTNDSGAPDYAYCSAEDDRSLWGRDILLNRLSSASNDGGQSHGQGTL